MTTRVLLVEDDSTDAYIFRRYLVNDHKDRFSLEHVKYLKDGLERLSRAEYEILLLDLGLPDSLGLETFCKVNRARPDVPVIVLSGFDDESTAVHAVREGAQDYLVKSEVTGPLLVRSIQYALERHAMQQELRSLSLTDELTGLYNRRGFQTLGEQQIKQARRAQRRLSLVFVDLDGLKDINDREGHQVGDGILQEAAAVLRESFRDTDILARLGGDEFAVLLADADNGSVTIPLERLRENVANRNARDPGRAYELSMSIGLACQEADADGSLDDLIASADEAMYHEKRGKKGRRRP